MQRWLWPIYFDTLKRYSDKNCGRFTLTRKMFDSDNFSKKCAQLAHVTYEEKPQLKINSFKNQKNGCFNSYSNIQSCLGYRCKLSIANLSWRVTCSYAYSPFNDIQCFVVGVMVFVVNRSCQLVNGGSLEIPSAVPFI